MRIIISPAKKMRVDTDSFSVEGLPQFLPQTEQLLRQLRQMPEADLQALWQCSDSIARLNQDRLRSMELHRRLTPALFSYEGIQYQYMAPGVFETGQLDYIREHLRILSGFYGLLRPFDGVAPYRLEMQARLPAAGAKDLYAFWGSELANQLAAETDLVLNLASKEYSRAVEPHLPSRVRCITCVFGERKQEKIIEKGTMCKMARGEMVRWLAENYITEPEKITRFSESCYRFSEPDSTQNRFVFIKGGI